MNEELSQALSFLGNSLLAPMTQTGAYGLDPAFWGAFPDFGDEGVFDAVGRMRYFAEDAQGLVDGGTEVVHGLSVEYTRLFVGPPKPAAPPWESFYVAPGVTVGYGQPAIEMRRILADMGLTIGGERNQYPDHMGIELLCLSEMVARGYSERARVFAAEKPGSWIVDFRNAVGVWAPASYYDALLNLVEELLRALPPMKMDAAS